MYDKKMENFPPKPEKIEKIRVPDEDVINWLFSLRAGGFTDDEIDGIMAHLNATYAEKLVEKRVKSLAKYLRAKYGTIMTESHKKELRKSLEEEAAKRHRKE